MHRPLGRLRTDRIRIDDLVAVKNTPSLTLPLKGGGKFGCERKALTPSPLTGEGRGGGDKTLKLFG